MRRLLIVTFVALPLLSAAQSQPPAPSAGESPSASQEQGAADQGQADIGTPGRPLTVRIAKDEVEATQEQDDRRRESSLQWGNFGVTVAIAFFTLGLVGVGIAQAMIYRRQAALMEGALTETRKAADAAKASADVAAQSIAAKVFCRQPKLDFERWTLVIPLQNTGVLEAVNLEVRIGVTLAQLSPQPHEIERVERGFCHTVPPSQQPTMIEVTVTRRARDMLTQTMQPDFPSKLLVYSLLLSVTGQYDNGFGQTVPISKGFQYDIEHRRFIEVIEASPAAERALRIGRENATITKVKLEPLPKQKNGRTEDKTESEN